MLGAWALPAPSCSDSDFDCPQACACLEASSSRACQRSHDEDPDPSDNLNVHDVENELSHGASSLETGRAHAGHVGSVSRPDWLSLTQSPRSHQLTNFGLEGTLRAAGAGGLRRGHSCWAEIRRDPGSSSQVFLRPWRFPVHVQRLHGLAEETCCPSARHPQISGYRLQSSIPD